MVNGIDLSLDSKSKTAVKKARVMMRRVKKNVTVSGREVEVTRVGVGPIKTPHGKFWQYCFSINDPWEKYTVLYKGEVDKHFMPVLSKEVLTIRTDSGCETGQVFHDLSCECRDQLHMAMKLIEERGEGMIVHIPGQDGRGKGIGFKLATLWLQDTVGMDTVESASSLAKVIDVRTYTGVVAVLRFFGIRSNVHIDLATNNPEKSKIFIRNGYKLDKMSPVIAAPTKETRSHLRAKQKHLGHVHLV